MAPRLDPVPVRQAAKFLAMPRLNLVRTRRLLTYRQAAEYAAVSYWTIRDWVEAGRLAAVRLPGGGRLLRIDVSDLDQLIDASKDTTA